MAVGVQLMVWHKNCSRASDAYSLNKTQTSSQLDQGIQFYESLNEGKETQTLQAVSRAKGHAWK